MEDLKKYQRRNLVIILLIIVGFGIFYAVRGGRAAPSFEMDGNRFLLRGPEDFETEIVLDRIASVELLESFRPETCVSGGTVDNCAYGTWENADIGRYQLCILMKVQNGIMAIEKDGKITIFNFESMQTTEDFYSSFTDLLRENGYI